MNNQSKRVKKGSLLDANSISKSITDTQEKKKHKKSNSNGDFAFNEKDKESNHLKEKLSNFMSNYDGM